MLLNELDLAWKYMLDHARRDIQDGVGWPSPNRKRPYSIVEVSNEQITIRRFKGKETKIKAKIAKSLIQQLMGAAGKLKRTEIRQEVAKFSAVFHLLETGGSCTSI